jgi:2-keto-3-deoxy-L-rhamnonate aldolase RhmA
MTVSEILYSIDNSYRRFYHSETAHKPTKSNQSSKGLIMTNHLRQKLSKQEPVFGVSFMEFQSVGWTTVFAHCGFDFLFIDMEHSMRSIERIGDLIWSAVHAGINPVIRVPSPQRFYISRVLDAGANSFIVPRVETIEQVESAIQFALYPPEGDRSLAGSGRNFNLLPQKDLKQATKTSNQETLISIQIETTKGLDNIEEIVKHPRIDMVFIGPADLSLTLGIPGQFDHRDFVNAVDRIIEVTLRHGHSVGMQSMNVDYSKKMMKKGLRFVCCGGAIGLIRQHGAEMVKQLKDTEL